MHADMIQKPNIKQARAGAFSLVELLLAISVITVLLALGMGVFAVMKQKGANTQCVANLRSINLGLSGYIGEFGYYPGAQPDYVNPRTGLPESRFWYHVLEPYVTGEAVPTHEDHAPKWMRCPSKLLPSGDKGYGYGYNYFGFGNFPQSIGWDPSIPRLKKYWHVRPASVEYPSRVPVIGDNRESGGYPRFIYNNTANPAVYAARHNEGGNYLFADGHIEWLSAQTMAARAPDKTTVYPFQ